MNDNYGVTSTVVAVIRNRDNVRFEIIFWTGCCYSNTRRWYASKMVISLSVSVSDAKIGCKYVRLPPGL